MLSVAKKVRILRTLWNLTLHGGLNPASDHDAQMILSQAYEQLAQLWRVDVYGHRF